MASLALLTNYLMANEFRDLTIRGVDVEISHSDRLQSARDRPRRGAEGARPARRDGAGLGRPRGLPRRPAARRDERAVPADTPPGTADRLRRRRERRDGLRPLALSAGSALARPGPRLPRRACGRPTRSTCSPTARPPERVVNGEALAALPAEPRRDPARPRPRRRRRPTSPTCGSSPSRSSSRCP